MFVAISCLFQAFILALILNSLGAQTILEGLLVSVVLWFGLTALTTVGVTLYQRQSWKFWWLNASYFLIVMSINGDEHHHEQDHDCGTSELERSHELGLLVLNVGLVRLAAPHVEQSIHSYHLLIKRASVSPTPVGKNRGV